MNTLFSRVLLSVFFSTAICQADVVGVNPAPNVPLAPNILKEQNLQTAPTSDVVDLGKIKIVYKPKRMNTLSIDNVAEQTAVSSPLADVLTPLSVDSKYFSTKKTGLIAALTPEYSVKKGFLSLTKVNYSRDKEAIMLVFLLNKDKAAPVKDNNRQTIHVLGSKKIFKDQQLIKNEYPVDVSTAPYEDGFAPSQWNVVLPNKKPREVKVVFLWSF